MGRGHGGEVKRAALLMAIALAACAPDPTLTVHATPALEGATQEALDAWNDALARGPCPEAGLSMIAHRDSADVTLRAGDAFGRAGYTDGSGSGARIVIDPPRSVRPLATTIAHELGHALGAEHSPHEEDIMSDDPPDDRGPEPTGFDVARVCAYVWGEDAPADP
jgi:hypothetical protein